jgi:uroporphyrinogen-III synthase
MAKNKTVISTQPAEQAIKLQALLNDDVLFYSMPLIETKTLKINPDIEQVFKTIRSFDRVVFTSKRGVVSFFDLAEQLNTQKQDLQKPEYAAIGKATAAEILKRGVHVQYINQGNTSKDFAAYLLYDVIKQSENILLPLGNLAPVFLQKELSKKANVKRINVYQTLKLKKVDNEILKIIDKNNYDLLIFTSPSAFENFLEITNYQNKDLKILSIGQTTTNFIESKGLKVQITAKKATIEGLINEIVNC